MRNQSHHTKFWFRQLNKGIGRKTEETMWRRIALLCMINLISKMQIVSLLAVTIRAGEFATVVFPQG